MGGCFYNIQGLDELTHSDVAKGAWCLLLLIQSIFIVITRKVITGIVYYTEEV